MGFITRLACRGFPHFLLERHSAKVSAVSIKVVPGAGAEDPHQGSGLAVLKYSKFLSALEAAADIAQVDQASMAAELCDYCMDQVPGLRLELGLVLRDDSCNPLPSMLQRLEALLNTQRGSAVHTNPKPSFVCTEVTQQGFKLHCRPLCGDNGLPALTAAAGTGAPPPVLMEGLIRALAGRYCNGSLRGTTSAPLLVTVREIQSHADAELAECKVYEVQLYRPAAAAAPERLDALMLLGQKPRQAPTATVAAAVAEGTEAPYMLAFPCKAGGEAADPMEGGSGISRRRMSHEVSYKETNSGSGSTESKGANSGGSVFDESKGGRQSGQRSRASQSLSRRPSQASLHKTSSGSARSSSISMRNSLGPGCQTSSKSTHHMGGSTSDPARTSSGPTSPLLWSMQSGIAAGGIDYALALFERMLRGAEAVTNDELFAARSALLHAKARMGDECSSPRAGSPQVSSPRVVSPPPGWASPAGRTSAGQIRPLIFPPSPSSRTVSLCQLFLLPGGSSNSGPALPPVPGPSDLGLLAGTQDQEVAQSLWQLLVGDAPASSASLEQQLAELELATRGSSEELLEELTEGLRASPLLRQSPGVRKGDAQGKGQQGESAPLPSVVPSVVPRVVPSVVPSAKAQQPPRGSTNTNAGASASVPFDQVVGSLRVDGEGLGAELPLLRPLAPDDPWLTLSHMAHTPAKSAQVLSLRGRTWHTTDHPSTSGTGRTLPRYRGAMSAPCHAPDCLGGTGEGEKASLAQHSRLKQSDISRSASWSFATVSGPKMPSTPPNFLCLRQRASAAGQGSAGPQPQCPPVSRNVGSGSGSILVISSESNKAADASTSDMGQQCVPPWSPTSQHPRFSETRDTQFPVTIESSVLPAAIAIGPAPVAETAAVAHVLPPAAPSVPPRPPANGATTTTTSSGARSAQPCLPMDGTPSPTPPPLMRAEDLATGSHRKDKADSFFTRLLRGCFTSSGTQPNNASHQLLCHQPPPSPQAEAGSRPDNGGAPQPANLTAGVEPRRPPSGLHGMLEGLRRGGGGTVARPSGGSTSSIITSAATGSTAAGAAGTVMGPRTSAATNMPLPRTQSVVGSLVVGMLESLADLFPTSQATASSAAERPASSDVRSRSTLLAPVVPAPERTNTSRAGTQRMTAPFARLAAGGKSVAARDSGASTSAMAQWQLLAIVKSPPEELLGVMASVDAWQFDMFALERVTGGRPLSFLAFVLLQRSGVVQRFHIDEAKLCRFLHCVEEGYGPHPYHNRTHAADVLRTLHVIATRGGLLQHVCTMEHLFNSGDLLAARQTNTSFVSSRSHPLEEHPDRDHPHHSAQDSFMLLSVYLAAIIHDYDHRGVNNAFLVSTADPLALLYNDASPMENHHVAAALTLLRRPECNFLGRASKQVFDSLRRHVIELVLATDMKRHFETVEAFQKKVVDIATPVMEPLPTSGRPWGTRGLASVSTGAEPAALARPLFNGPTRDLPLASGTTDLWRSLGVGTTGSTALNSYGNIQLLSLQGYNDQSSGGCAAGPFLLDGKPPALPRRRSDLSVDSWPFDMAQERSQRQLAQPLSRAILQLPPLSLRTSLVEEHGAGGQMTVVPMYGTGMPPLSGGSSRALGSQSAVLRASLLRLPAVDVGTLNAEARMLIWKMALKCADLGHLACPQAVHLQWVAQLEEELFRQGDRERELGLPVSPLMDRTKEGITKSQPGFFQVVVLPLYSAFAAAFPAITPLLQGVQDNHAMWLEAATAQPAGP